MTIPYYIYIYIHIHIYIYTWKHWQTTTSLTTPSHPYNPQVNPLNPCLFVQELASFVNIPLPSFITRVLGRGAPSNTSKKATALTHVRHEEFKNQVIQGDLLIPQLEVTIRPLKGSFNHPKKVTKNCQKHIFLVWGWQIYPRKLRKRNLPPDLDRRLSGRCGENVATLNIWSCNPTIFLMFCLVMPSPCLLKTRGFWGVGCWFGDTACRSLQ